MYDSSETKSFHKFTNNSKVTIIDLYEKYILTSVACTNTRILSKS